MSKAIIVLCTCPNEDDAVRLAEALVSEHLAACVNILPGILSIYRWQGKVETTREHLLLIKSAEESFLALKSCIEKLHPYETPEIVALSICAGSETYLAWLLEQLQDTR